jgi:hypothetical protein
MGIDASFVHHLDTTSICLCCWKRENGKRLIREWSRYNHQGKDALEIAERLGRDGVVKVFDPFENKRKGKEKEKELHSKVTLKSIGLKEVDFDSSLKSKQNDVPIHKIASLFCEKFTDAELWNYEEVYEFYFMFSHTYSNFDTCSTLEFFKRHRTQIDCM